MVPTLAPLQSWLRYYGHVSELLSVSISSFVKWENDFHLTASNVSCSYFSRPSGPAAHSDNFQEVEATALTRSHILCGLSGQGSRELAALYAPKPLPSILPPVSSYVYFKTQVTCDLSGKSWLSGLVISWFSQVGWRKS